MGQLWIEATSDNGEEFSSRWGAVTDNQIDMITTHIESVLGPPDTVR